MKSENLPNPRTEQYEPNLEAQDEDVLSGGNNRLTYILVGIILALVIGYVALPKGSGTGLSSVTPSFMLDDAAVTATVPAADNSAAAPEAADEANAEVDNARPTKKTAKSDAAVAAGTSAEPVVAAAAPVAAPEPAATAPVAAAEPAAPSNVTMTGKIEDENGRPMVGATVLLKGSSKGTSTDANGNYTLEVPAGNDNTLIYGYGGYDDEVMRVSSGKPVNVTLTPRAKASKHRR